MTKPILSIISRSIACTNKIWNVYFTHVRHGAVEVPNYLVMEPKVRIEGNVTGAAVLPVMNGRIGLVRIFRVAMSEDFWEAPKGFIDMGENARAAALRELGEETGLACAANDVIPLGTVTTEASTLAARISIFAALNCRPVGAIDDQEVGLSGMEFFSPDQIRDMAAGSVIEDATTVAGLYRLLAKGESDPAVRKALKG
jgi:ADP-ribose pyrophosphatase YjhB (NUDIX family)